MHGTFHPCSRKRLPDWLSQLVFRHWPSKGCQSVASALSAAYNAIVWAWVPQTLTNSLASSASVSTSQASLPLHSAKLPVTRFEITIFESGPKCPQWRTIQNPKLPTTLGIPAVAEVCVSRPLFYIHDIKVKRYSQREPMVALSMVFKQIWKQFLFGVYLDLRLLETTNGKMGWFESRKSRRSRIFIFSKVTPNKKNTHKPWKSLAINSYRLVSEFHHYFSRGLSSSKRKWQRLPGITFESKNLLNLCGTIF